MMNDILSVMTPGREFTSEDVWNRLKDKGKRYIPDAVADELAKMSRIGALHRDFYKQGTTDISIYRVKT